MLNTIFIVIQHNFLASKSEQAAISLSALSNKSVASLNPNPMISKLITPRHSGETPFARVIHATGDSELINLARSPDRLHDLVPGAVLSLDGNRILLVSVESACTAYVPATCLPAVWGADDTALKQLYGIRNNFFSWRPNGINTIHDADRLVEIRFVPGPETWGSQHETFASRVASALLGQSPGAELRGLVLDMIRCVAGFRRRAYLQRDRIRTDLAPRLIDSALLDGGVREAAAIEQELRDLIHLPSKHWGQYRIVAFCRDRALSGDFSGVRDCPGPDLAQEAARQAFAIVTAQNWTEAQLDPFVALADAREDFASFQVDLALRFLDRKMLNAAADRIERARACKTGDFAPTAAMLQPVLLALYRAAQDAGDVQVAGRCEIIVPELFTGGPLSKERVRRLAATSPTETGPYIESLEDESDRARCWIEVAEQSAGAGFEEALKRAYAEIDPLVAGIDKVRLLALLCVVAQRRSEGDAIARRAEQDGTELARAPKLQIDFDAVMRQIDKVRTGVPEPSRPSPPLAELWSPLSLDVPMAVVSALTAAAGHGSRSSPEHVERLLEAIPISQSDDFVDRATALLVLARAAAARSDTSDVSKEQIDAYRQAQYRVRGTDGNFDLRIDRPSPDLKALYGAMDVGSAAFLTAYNPLGSAHASEANERAQADLTAKLEDAGVTFLHGIGLDPAGIWDGEPSVLALNVSLPAARLIGEEFGQNAIVWAGGDAIPRLILLR